MRVLKFSLLCAALFSLNGCIVVPYEASEGHVGPRTDMPATVPDSIAKGKTTRAEVLQDEGKPDAEGDGESWFVYSSTSKESGLGLFFCAAGNYNVGCGDARRQVWDYRRLVVRFDAAGVVSDAHVDSASCVLWTRNFQPPVPCLDLRGDDLRRADALAVIEKGQPVLATFQDVRWPADQENNCLFYGKLVVTQAALYFVADIGSPFNNQHYQVDPARCPEPDRVVSFDAAEIADLSVVEGISGHQVVKLSRKDGSHFTWQFIVHEDDGKPAGDSMISHVTATAKDIKQMLVHDADDEGDDSTPANAAAIAADIKQATGTVPESFGGLHPADQGVPRTYDHVRWCSGWDPPTIAIVQRQIPCERPKDGYLILTATGFMFQLADAGDGVAGLVAGQYVDVRSEGLHDSGLLGSYSHWVVVETKDGQIDAFDPDYSDARKEIDAIFQGRLPKPP